MNTQTYLIVRWDTFLEKINTRFQESLKHAETACSEQLVETDYEYETVFRSWQGMKAQIHELIRKIDTVWDGKVMPEMRAMGDFYTDEAAKGSQLNDSLTETLFSFERQLEGKLSRAYYDHAIQSADKKSFCTQCDAKLAIRKDIFRAQYISCPYCNTVNTIEPDTKFMKLGWGIIDNIAAMNCQKEYAAMENALSALHALRKSERGVAEWASYENAYYHYWEKYFQERIVLNADAQERYVAVMERKRKEFENYKEIQTK